MFGTTTTDVIRIMDPNLRGGFAQLPRAILKARRLSDRAKVVYALLLDYAWQQGSCFPGQKRLAQDLDTTERTIQRALTELRDYALISWRRRGMTQTNVYLIHSLGDNPNLVPAEGDPTNLSYQEATILSGQDTTVLSPKEYSRETYPERPRSKFETQKQDEKKHGGMSSGSAPAPQRRSAEQTRDRHADRPHPAHRAEPEGSNRRIPNHDEPAAPDGGRPLTPAMTLGEILEQRKDLARFKATTRGEVAAPTSSPATFAQERGAVASPALPKRGRPPGSREEREHLAAYLIDWLAQFNDQAPPSSSITRALNTFKAANIAPGLWGGYLHRAKSLLREHQAKVTTRAANQGNVLQPKNLTPYYFAILEDLVGLRGDPAPSASARVEHRR